MILSIHRFQNWICPSDAVGDLDMGELSFKPSTKDLWDAETHHFELIGIPNRVKV